MDIQTAIQNVQHLPPTPKLLPRMRGLLRDGNSSVNDILALIKVDASLAAQVVRVSNSAFYGASQPSQNIDEAISRIGFNEVYKLVAFVAASQAFNTPAPFYNTDPGQMWEASITCGILMQFIAQAQGEDSDAAYTVGLFHSIGKVVINSICSPAPGWTPPADVQMPEAQPEENEPVTMGEDGKPQIHADKLFLADAQRRIPLTPEDEKALLGFDYAEVGAALLGSWEFPEEMCQPIAHQTTWQQAPDEWKSAAAALALAKATQPWIGNNPTDILPNISNASAYLEATGLNPDEFAGALVGAKAALSDVRDLIDSV